MGSHDRSTVDDWVQLPARELVVTVAIAPAPEIALASLRPMVAPVHDETDQLIDWTMVPAGYLDHDSVSEFRVWRASWCRQWPMGSISDAESLLREVAHIDHDLGRTLDHVLNSLVRANGALAITVPADLVPSIRRELATARLALAADERLGTGIVDDMPSASRGHGLSRAWADPIQTTVLAATPELAVVIEPERGLTLVYTGSGSSSEAIEFDGVAAVDMRSETVVVLNQRGSSMRLSQSEARALGWVVPRSLRWHVRPVPIVAIWAQLFDALFEALDAAERSMSPIRIGTIEAN